MNKLFAFIIFLLSVSNCSIAQQAAPAIEWQKCIGGSGYDKANSIIKTPDNGFLVVGSSKSNDGDVSGHHGSLTTSDAWVVKISENGNIEWQKSLGGSKDDVFNSVISTKDGSYICFGSTFSNDGDVSGFHGTVDMDLWVVKINRYGSIIWQKCLGGSGGETPGSIKEASDGSLYVIGSSSGSNDGDVSGNNRLSDVWTVKLSSDGNIIAQKCFGGFSNDNGYDIYPLNDGGFYMAIGTSAAGGNLGVSPSGNPPYGYLIRIDASWNSKWGLFFIQRSETVAITKKDDNKYFVTRQNLNCYPQNPNDGLSVNLLTFGARDTIPGVTGSIGYSVCFPTPYTFTGYPVEGTTHLAVLNDLDNVIVGSTDDSINNPGIRNRLYGFMAGFKASGPQNWKKTLGGSQPTGFTSISAISETEFLVCGYTYANDGDVSGNHGNADAWIVKMGRTNNIKGSVYVDYNVNGLKDANEPYLKGALVESVKSGAKYSSASIDGRFYNAVDTGTYSTSVISNIPYYSAIPASLNSSFTAYNSSDSLSFALQPQPGKRDYSVKIFSATTARPGFAGSYVIQLLNAGTDTLNNKQIRFIKDSRVTFVSAQPAQQSVSGDTIVWNVPSLSPRETTSIEVKVNLAAPPALNISDTLLSRVIVDTTSDLTPSNNATLLKQIVFGSYDPNDKRENFAGELGMADVSSGKSINYTIRFQNTGNDTAFNVTITDTLDAKLDWTSIEMTGASHAYRLNIKDGNKLTWTFHNIKLVDSIHNEPLSHGYVSFDIRPKNNLTVGDVIKNNADIYFDFNPPVRTNTTFTAFKILAPNQPVVSGVQNTYCSSDGLQYVTILNAPAVEYAATVEVKLDGNILIVAPDARFSFNPSALSAGAHSITVSYSNSAGSKTNTILFNVKAIVTPDVNVSANITTVVNLSDAVVITATNASGGGLNPRYTFAKDRAISNILQAESASGTLTLTPASLVVGDNWIYSRMRTSDTCYTAATNVDSIKIVRSAVTGLVDVDHPAQIINIYPNPFDQNITVNGLSNIKAYTIQLTDINGKSLYRKYVTNSAIVVLTKTGLPTGTYWLSIYDEKKKRLIGTVPILKK